MNIASALVAAGLAVLTAITVVGVVFAIIHNVKVAQEFREQLARRLEGLRLSKMLGLRGIDQTRYLHERPVTDIQLHMQRCDGCGAKDKCDDEMESGEPVTDYSFCPNAPSLSESVPAAKAGT